MKNIWILAGHREGAFEETTFGLIGEARRLLSEGRGDGKVTAVVLGHGLSSAFDSLERYGAHQILYVEGGNLRRYQGELFARVVSRLIKRDDPACLLVAQTDDNSDLCPRVAAFLETGLVTCAMDLRTDPAGGFLVTRPVNNGYLFEDVHVSFPGPAIVSFLPSVLTPSALEMHRKAEAVIEPLDEPPDDLKTRVIQVIKADPGDLDISEADIVVAGGRGVGKGPDFEIIHELARIVGGSVAGTRPVIDWETLPYERQIGQTGKTVAARLIINCGISGANEYTSGMEKSQLVMAINTDPRARIFRFSDLGIVGDVHTLLPLLIEQIKEMRDTREIEESQ